MVIVNKKKQKTRSCRIVNFAVTADHRVKLKEREKRDKYLDLAIELKTIEHEGDGNTNCNWCTWNNPQRIGKGTWTLGNKRTRGNHPDNSIIKIIWEESERLEETCCHWSFIEKLSAYAGVKNSQSSKIIIIKLLWDLNIQTDHLIPARRPDLIIIHKNKRIYKIVDFAVPADHRINLKECAKKDKYLDLARELKKLCNMKVMIVPIVIGALGTITKGL